MEYVNLKKVTGSVGYAYFVAVGLTFEKYQTLKDDLDALEKYIRIRVMGQPYETIDLNILFIGDLEKYKYYSKLVYKYKKKHFEGASIYRNYCVTKEQQAVSQMYVNVAQDADTSWNTVKTALGAKNIKEACYGVIVEFIALRTAPVIGLKEQTETS